MSPTDPSPSAARRYLARLFDRCALAPSAAAPDPAPAPVAAVAVDWWQDGPDDFLGASVATDPSNDDVFPDVAGARTWTQPSATAIACDAELATMLPEALASWTEADSHALAEAPATLALADSGALRHLFDLLGGLDALVVHDSGPIARSVVSALRSEDPPLQRQALQMVRKFGLRVVQREVAGLLDAPALLGHDGIEATLDALAELADGRVVRRLEEVLATRGPELSQHQAWRARHIVQVIRRAGRR